MSAIPAQSQEPDPLTPSGPGVAICFAETTGDNTTDFSSADAQAVRDEGGNVLRDIELTFRVRFPEGPDGDAARAALPRAVQTSHDRTCTVSRTIEAGVPVGVRID